MLEKSPSTIKESEILYKSPFTLSDAKENLIKVKNAKNVIIFGTGNLGKIVIAALKKEGINIICLSDNNRSRWNTIYNGYKVIPPEELKKTDNSTPIILASDLTFPYMHRQLQQMGIKNVYDSDFLFEELDLEMEDLESMGVYWSKVKIKQKIDSYLYDTLAQKNKDKVLNVKCIDLVLTEKCSLKCDGCSNLMQYYAKPIDEDFEQCIKSIDKFMNTIDYVYEIRVIGGEPLMYKRIYEVIEHLYKYDNYGKLQINTNGTICPKPDKMEVFKNDKVFFDISDYGEKSRNLDKLKSELRRLNIKHNSQKSPKWQDCGRIVETDRTKEENKEVFGNCCENQGLTILHGKLYLCPFAANATNLHAIPYFTKEIIELEKHDGKELKNLIHNLYFKTEYLEACKSCNGRDHNVGTIDAAVQLKQPVKYDIINTKI